MSTPSKRTCQLATANNVAQHSTTTSPNFRPSHLGHWSGWLGLRPMRQGHWPHNQAGWLSPCSTYRNTGIDCATSHSAASIDGVAVNRIDQFGVTIVSNKQISNMSLWQLPTTRSPQLHNIITTPSYLPHFLGYDGILCIQVSFISSSYCNLFLQVKLSKDSRSASDSCRKHASRASSRR